MSCGPKQVISNSGGGGITPVVAPFASRPSLLNGQLFFPTDNGFSQASDGTYWYNLVGGVPLREPDLAAIALRTNFGTSTIASTHGMIVCQSQPVAGPVLRMAGKAIVTLASASVTHAGAINAPSGNFDGIGVYMRESSTQKCLSFVAVNALTTLLFTRTTWTADGATRASFTDFNMFTSSVSNSAPVLTRLQISTTNVLCQASIDGGNSWLTFQTLALTTPFTTAPDQFGLGYINQQAGTPGPTCSTFHLGFTGD